MTITLKIPAAAEQALREAWGQNLSEAAFEALLIEGYRTGKLSTGDIAQALCLETRFGAERWLAAHGVSLNYTLADLETDQATLDRVLGPVTP